MGGPGGKRPVDSFSALAESYRAESQFPRLFVKLLLLAFQRRLTGGADGSHVQANLQPGERLLMPEEEVGGAEMLLFPFVC